MHTFLTRMVASAALVLTCSVGLASEISASRYNCSELLRGVEANGYLDVDSYRVYSLQYVNERVGNSCANAGGEWVTFSAKDVNRNKCTFGLICQKVSSQQSNKSSGRSYRQDSASRVKNSKGFFGRTYVPGGWRGSNGVFHSGDD